MHGFIGFAEEDTAHADPMRRWMEAWISTPPEKRRFEVRQGPFFFTASKEPSTKEDPVAFEDGGLVLGFNGFIAADQLADQDNPAPKTHDQIAAALLRRYRAKGAESLASLNGRYLAWVWNPAEHRLELMNDMLGLKPIFLWHRGTSFVFASNVWAIVCHPKFDKTIDRRGLADLLLLSHQQGERTLFEDVSILPPGSVTTWEAGKVSSRVVRNLAFSQERWDWSMDRIADDMYALMQQSVRRRVANGARVRLPLTGGFDSRVLLGLLAARPVTVHAVTQTQHGHFGMDSRYARQLARIAGVQHTVVPFGDGVFARYRQQCVAINGGMYDIHTGRFLSLLELSGGEQIPTVSAHLGGEFTCRFQIPDTKFSTPDEHFRLAFEEVNSYRFAPDRLRRLMDGSPAADRVEDSVEDCRRFFVSHPGSYFQRFFNWDLLLYRRRYISYQLLYYEQFAPVIVPFYDRDFADFMCSVPFAAVEGQRAYLAMMRRYFPVLARVPNTNTALPVLISTKAVVRDFVDSQYKRFFRRPLQRLLHPRRWVDHPNVQFGFALCGGSRAVLDHILASKERLAEYLNPQEVQEAVDRQVKGDHSSSLGLLSLSTFATALEMLEDPHAAVRAFGPSSTSIRPVRRPGGPRTCG